MKKVAGIALALIVLVTGCVLADPGMKSVEETQGIKVETSVSVVGRIDSDVYIDWETSNEQPLNGEDSAPPLVGDGSTVYEATYSEDTLSVGEGIISYGTTLDIETGAVITPLSNIKTGKKIYYASTDKGRIYSSDSIHVGGSGLASSGDNVRSLCPFTANGAGGVSPAFCTNVEMGSEIDMDFANVVTGSDARFITKAADYPVEVNYVISVGALDIGIPSSGTASAFMNAVIREGRDENADLYEEIKFAESTSFNGEIDNFMKVMHYESGPTR